MLVHERGVAGEVALQEQFTALVAERLGSLQIVDHALIARARPRVLVREDPRRGADAAGVEEQQLVPHLAQRLGVEFEGLHVD